LAAFSIRAMTPGRLMVTIFWHGGTSAHFSFMT
jgi:hypothetical protein